MKITSKKQIIMMYVFTSLVYFMSYITRVNYNTILVEISSAENIPRSLLVLPLTASFVTYGFGQIISGWLGDKFDAFKVVSSGLLLSAVMNILLPLYPKPYAMNHSQVSRHKKAQFFRGSGYLVCSQYKASASLGVSILSVPCGLFVL